MIIGHFNVLKEGMFVICPRCGNDSFQEMATEKGKQKKCTKCGYEGNPMGDFT